MYLYLSLPPTLEIMSTEKLNIQSRPRIILSRSISRLNEILFHYKQIDVMTFKINAHKIIWL